MGFKNQNLLRKESASKGNSYKCNMQSYYSKLYENVIDQLKREGHDLVQIDKNLMSIFSRTKLPTKTIDNQLIKLLDIDKIISINEGSLKQNSQEVKHMRMVASLKHQNQIPPNSQDGNGLRQIENLVRMARLHFMQMNRPQGEQQSSEEQQDNHIQEQPSQNE